MKITANGKELDFTGSIQQLVESYKLNKDSIVVERNGEIVHRENYKTTQVTDGDIIELVKFVGGG